MLFRYAWKKSLSTLPGWYFTPDESAVKDNIVMVDKKPVSLMVHQRADGFLTS